MLSKKPRVLRSTYKCKRCGEAWTYEYPGGKGAGAKIQKRLHKSICVMGG